MDVDRQAIGFAAGAAPFGDGVRAPPLQEPRRAAQPLDLATRGCALPTAPFAFRRVGGGDDFTVTVDVSRSTNVPWSSGGLLVTADAADGSSEWLALRVERGDAIVFEGGASADPSAAWRSTEGQGGTAETAAATAQAAARTCRSQSR